MVMAKTKRKKVNTFDLREADLIAPVNSQRMAYYNNNSKLKILDYSSGDDKSQTFCCDHQSRRRYLQSDT